MSILITGGYGYIGSHTIIELVSFMSKNENYSKEVIVIDDLSNSKGDIEVSLNKILKSETNKEGPYFTYLNADITNYEVLKSIFESCKVKGKPIESVIHFAAKKAVGESTQNPILYYKVNVTGSIQLLTLCQEYDTKTFIFSSSATVYGDQPKANEDSPIKPVNPYGKTKVMVEQIMEDFCKANPGFTAISLRYFNPCGAHKSGLIGEIPNVVNNLFPGVEQVYMGKRDKIFVWGNDYPTLDGTGVRDYIHIVDLARAHVKAFQKSFSIKGYEVYNIGSSKGYSVLEVLKSYEKACGKEIPYEIAGRRDGDVASITADVSKAEKELDFKTEFTMEDICRDSVNFVNNNLN